LEGKRRTLRGEGSGNHYTETGQSIDESLTFKKGARKTDVGMKFRYTDTDKGRL